jgi:putative ABC transport system permease protein
MLLKEVLSQAWHSLVAHRFRAGLTMLGIAWGIVTVTSLMAYGNGFHNALLFGFSNAANTGVAIIYGGQTSVQAGGERAGKRVFLKLDDVESIRQLGLVKAVSPEIYESLPLSYGNRQTTAGVRGVAPDYGDMRHELPSEGRFINAEDVDRRRRVAFVGTEVALKLFGHSPAVGETIRIRGVSFEVIGVLAEKAQLSSYFYPDQESVFIPYTSTEQIFHQDYLDTLVVQTIAPDFHEQGMRQVRGVLAERHRFDPRDERALMINDSAEIRATVGAMATGLKVILVFIGSLTLMIGGVGVMNIMLVSVTERTREIGVRKALGARRRHILLQFLGLAGWRVSY